MCEEEPTPRSIIQTNLKGAHRQDSPSQIDHQNFHFFPLSPLRRIRNKSYVSAELGGMDFQLFCFFPLKQSVSEHHCLESGAWRENNSTPFSLPRETRVYKRNYIEGEGPESANIGSDSIKKKYNLVEICAVQFVRAHFSTSRLTSNKLGMC